jgi:CubicO group peptidase (beta-lactamase class C family)
VLTGSVGGYASEQEESHSRIPLREGGKKRQHHRRAVNLNGANEPAAAVLIILLFVGAMAPTGAQAVAFGSAPSRAPINQFVREWMRANGVPGLALAITQGTSVIHLSGHGDAGDGPVTPDTQFFVASLSKSFTALAVLQLVEAGRIDLEAPIRTYLPRFALADAAASERITVRMLLNQTSGMADARFPELTLPQPDSIAERVRSLRDAELVDEPGTAFHYFNPNYAVLARLVEVVAGQPFSKYLRDNVFIPLGMNETTNAVTSIHAASIAPHLAQGHILAFGIPIAWEASNGYLGGSGGVISTAQDMARWLIMQSERGVFQGHSLLSSRGIELMHTPPAGIDTSYAMGWARTLGTPGLLEHTGVLSTFFAEQALLPDERVGIVFLANVYNGFVNFEGLMQGLLDLVMGERDAVGSGARRIGIILGAVAALIVAVGLWKILRVGSWTERRRGRAWRTALGVGVPFVPAVVTALTPTLVARFSDRVFGWRLLVLAFPDVMVCLIAAGAAGAVLGIVRLISVARRARPLSVVGSGS